MIDNLILSPQDDEEERDGMGAIHGLLVAILMLAILAGYGWLFWLLLAAFQGGGQ